MASLRKFSIVLLVVAAVFGLMASPAQAQPSPNCSTNNFPSTMTLGDPYTLACNASGGVPGSSPEYTWSISTGSIPSGMTSNSFSNGLEFQVTGTASLAGTYAFTVTVTDGNGNSGSQQFSVTVSSSSTGTGTASGTISLTSVSASSLTAGQATTLYLYGSNFTANTVAYFNNNEILPTYFVNAGTLYINLQAYQVISGTIPIYVHDPTNGTSGTLELTVLGGATGTLTLYSISPSSAPLDSPAVTVTINGSGFSAGSSLVFGSICNVGTTYLSSTELTATIPASCLTTAGTYNVSVGTSNTVTFTVGGTSTGSSGIIALTSVYPTTLTAGTTTTLQVYGVNFTPNTQVYFNNSYVQTTYQNSSTFITATVQGSLITAGTFPVHVYDPTNGTSTSLYVTVSGSSQSGIISLISLSPTSVSAGNTFQLYVYGSNFTPNSIIHFNNEALSASYMSSTTLSVYVPGSYVTSGSLPVYVTDSTNGTSGTLYVTVSGTSQSGIISLTQVSPATMTAGTSATLYVFGSNFTPSSIIHFNNNSLAANYVNSTEIYTTVPGTYVISGSLPVYVSDPTNGISGTQYVTVSGSSSQSGIITLTQLSPTTMTAGLSATLYAFGTNFTPSSIIHFNNNSLAANYVNSTEIYTTVPGSYVTSGSLPVYVSDPTNGTSGTQYVTVSGSSSQTGIITLTQVSPTTLAAGTSTTFYAIGSNFTPSSIIHFNNNSLSANYVSSSEIYTTVPAAYVTSGSLPVYVSDPTNGTSGTLYVTVSGSSGTSGIVLSSLSPSSIPAGSAAFTLTVLGSGFSAGADVSFGTICTLGTNFVSSTQLTVTVPASCVATAGTLNVSVGGSNALQFTVGTSSSSGTLSVTCSPSNGPTTLGTAFSQTCSVTGGIAPYTWTVAGLPTGLSQSAYTGGSTVTISGTPATAQSYAYVVQATDSSSPNLTGSVSMTGTITSGSSSTYNITSISPTSIAVGSAATTVTVFGNGFTGSSQVYFNGAPLATSFVSSTEVYATIPAASLTTAQTVSITVNTSGTLTNAQSLVIGSSSSSSGNLTVTCSPGVGPQTQLILFTTTCSATGGTQPYNWSTTSLPVYLAISATTGQSITIAGTPTGPGPYNFIVKVTDSSVPNLTNTLQIAGQVATTSTTGSGISLTSISPNSAAVNSAAITLTVIGVGFANTSQVVFNGFPIVTTYVNGNELIAAIPAGLLTYASAALVTVSTPGVGTSNGLSFIVGTNVANPVSITCTPGVGPTTPNSYYTQTCSASGGNGPFTWSMIAGSLPTGLALTTTVGTQTTITGFSTLTGPYSYTLQVTDSSSPPNVATATFAGTTGTGVSATAVSLTSISPSSIVPGAGATLITINGANFATSAVAYFNGTALATTFINSTQLTAVVPSSLLISATSANITVQSIGLTSNALVLTVGSGPSTAITISCNPTTGPPGVGAQYSTTCTASGGKAPYAWSIVNGFLPSGIVLGYSTSSTVTITGAATAIGLTTNTYSYALQVTDSSTPAQTATYPFNGTLPNGQGGAYGGTITSLNPVSAPVNSSGFTLTVSGNGFQSGVSFILFGGTVLSTNYISSNQLSASIPAYLLTIPGTVNVIVETNGFSTNTVGFYVSGASAVTATPASLSFSYALGGGLPAAQTITLSSGTTVTGFSLSASGIANNINWLTATPTSGTLPGAITVIVAPTGLPVGTYSGALSVTGYGVGASLTVPVTLTVLGSLSMLPSPTTLSFSTPAGTTAATQTLKITASDGQTVIPFSASALANNGGSWLSVSPTSGSTPGTLTVTAASGTLPASTYSGQINVNPTGGVGSALAIPVTFTVTAPVTLTASPTSLSFNGVTGQSNPAAQTINLTSSSAANYTVAVATASGGNWLSATASGSATPGTISVTAAIGSLAAGTYKGSVTVTSTGAANSPLTVPVTFTVANPAPLTTSPTSLTYSYQVGGTAPASQTLTVSAPSGGTGTYSYSIAVSTGTGGNWLSVSPASGNTSSSVAVSVNTANLAAGTYTGTLTITATGAASSTVQVTLTVSPAAPILSVSPQTLTFNATSGATAPAPQTVAVTTTNSTTANYTVTASSSGNWLTATASGTTPGTVNVSVNSSTLAVGTYSGSLSIASPGATNTPQTVEVTLNVAAPPAISAAPTSLAFFVPGNGAAPAPQTVTVISTGGNTNFTASAFSQGGNWLSVSGGGATPGSVVVSVNPSGLTAGQTYNGSVTINAPSSNPSSIQIAVSMTVASTGVVPLQITPSALYLYYDQGAGSDLEHVLVLNPGGGSVSYQVQGQSLDCGSWLNVVTPTGTATATAPGVIGIDVNPSGMNAQTCHGSISLTDSNANTATIPVYMAISSATQSILLSQTAMNFVAGAGGSTPAGQTFEILNPGSGSMPWNITTSTLSGGSWLTASPNSGNALSLGQPGSPITVTVNQQGLSAGTYYGSVQVASSGAFDGPKSITVSLTVLASGTNPPALVAPQGVILTGINGSANSQTVNITNSGANALSYSAILSTDDGQSWLTVNTASGTIPAGGTNAVSVSASLNGIGTGLRHGTLRLAFSDGTVQTVDVRLAVAGAASGSTGVGACGPTNLVTEFLSPQQNLQASAQVAIPIQVLVQDCNGNMLSSSNTGVDVLAGTSNTDVRMNYVGNGIWAGTWTPPSASSALALTADAVEVVGSAEATGSVTLDAAIGTAPANAPPYVSAVVNAGSFVLPGLVAPGTMVSIFGSSLADGQSQVFSTPFPTSLQGAKFSVRGVAMPVFYASAAQVNAIVPIGIAADERDQLIVVRDTTQSAPIDLLVADQDPGIFTINSQGQGAILVGGTSQIAAPAGSIPGANAGPATAGQTVSIYVAGLGTVSNPPADGSPSTGTSLTTATPVVTIGGLPAQVTYSGLAPGEVGLYQVNVVVPAGVATGNAVPVVITIGNGVSNTVTMALM